MRKFVLFAILVVFCSIVKAAPPVLGPDCGTGATVVGDKTGDKYAAGKVTIGANPDGNVCTLSMTWARVPSCSAVIESGIRAEAKREGIK